MRRSFVAVVLCVAAVAAHAQWGLSEPDPDWRESQVPPPPAVRTDKLVMLEMPRSLLKWGVDASSVSIGSDDIVRYVVVTRSESGAVNAMYEGIRCNTWQVKQYARHAGGNWVTLRDSDWQPLNGSLARVHSLAIAKNGACGAQGRNRTPEQVARDLARSGQYGY